MPASYVFETSILAFYRRFFQSILTVETTIIFDKNQDLNTGRPRIVSSKPKSNKYEFIMVGSILLILAMIIIPEFSKAEEDPIAVKLSSKLQLIQSQLEIYRVQHQNQYPCGDPKNPVEPALFITRLTHRTSENHQPDGPCGPYLDGMPVNPLNGFNTVRYGTNPGTNQAGWCFNSVTGIISSDVRLKCVIQQ